MRPIKQIYKRVHPVRDNGEVPNATNHGTALNENIVG
jgi:hypothetical protein